MSEEFKKWISNKKFEIFDEINEKSNKDNKDFLVFNNHLLSSSDIKVFHSNQSILQSLVNNEMKNLNNNVLKWFKDFKLRQEVLKKFSQLLNKSTKVLEFLETVLTNTSINVSQKRVKNLLKSLNYGLNYQIFNHLNELAFNDIGYTVLKVFESQSVLLKAIYELIASLVSGIPVIIITEDKIAIYVSYLLDLLSNCGLESGIIQMVIIDNKTAVKQSETTKPKTSPKFIIFESADIESAINRLLESHTNDTIGSIDVFVQQSVCKKFCQRLESLSNNTLEIGDRFDPKVDILSKLNINYEAIDFDNENKSFGLQVFKFRTTDEMKSLIKHFVDIQFMSLWSEKTSLALEFARIVDSSEDIYINSCVKFPLKTEISILDKVLNKIEMNLISDNKLLQSMLTSNKKWKTTPEEEREQIIRSFLFSTENKFSINPLSLSSGNQTVDEIKDKSGFQLRIKDFEAIGLVVIEVNEEINERIFSFILLALISGNSVVTMSAKPNNQLNELKKHLSTLGQNVFDSIGNHSSGVKGNAVLMYNSKPIGLYLKDLQNISQKSLKKFKKSIALSFGDLSFAK